jgi:crotonobetainyl-CoA:carnitine CoA-transferase CaiB-like acyl-CoA transferase
MLTHPQVQANDLITNYDHPQAGQIRQTRAPARFSAAPQQPWNGAPALGQNTSALLAECGYSDEKIQDMLDSGAAVERDSRC